MDEFMKVVTQNYANFTGRARRREFWNYILIYSVINLVLLLLIGMTAGSNPESPSAIAMVFYGIYALLNLALLIPTYAATARRLHDTGRSGWLQLLQFVPIAGFVLIYFLAQDSQPGSNKWGPNPKGESVGAVNAQSW